MIYKQPRFFPLIIFVLVAFLLFYHLDMRTLRLWDEARLAVNAANMLGDKNYFFTSYQHAPDFWNTKPHLLILLQVISMKVLGFSEASIRLPSAIATFFCCSLIYYWVKNEIGSVFFACLAILVFICTRYLSFHGARAGDYEALLILWELSYCYAMYTYMQNEKARYLWLGFIALTLAVLTKGIAGFLFTPAIVLFAFLKRKMSLFLKSESFYFALSFFIICIVAYYGIHEFLTPGYLNQVFKNEIGGRYLNSVENHHKSLWFYFNSFSILYFYFFPILFINLIYLFWNRSVVARHLLLQYILSLSLTFFVIISFSQSKISWYAYPLYPLMGIFIAILTYDISQKLDILWRKRFFKFIILWMMLAYGGAVIAMLASTRESESLTSFIKKDLSYNDPKDYKIIVDDVNQYDGSLEFQSLKYLAKTRHNLIRTTLSQLHAEDWVIMENNQTNKISTNLMAKLYFKKDYFGVYQIKVK